MQNYEWIIGAVIALVHLYAIVFADNTDPELDHIRDQAGMF